MENLLFLFSCEQQQQQKTVFFFSVVVVVVVFYQMCISCTSLWLVERSLVFVSETFSIRFFMENRKPENVT